MGSRLDGYGKKNWREKPTMTKERKARQDTEAWEERDMNKEKRYVDEKDEEEEEGEGTEEL